MNPTLQNKFSLIKPKTSRKKSRMLRFFAELKRTEHSMQKAGCEVVCSPGLREKPAAPVGFGLLIHLVQQLLHALHPPLLSGICRASLTALGLSLGNSPAEAFSPSRTAKPVRARFCFCLR